MFLKPVFGIAEASDVLGVAKETAIKSEIKIIDVNLSDDAENTVIKI